MINFENPSGNKVHNESMRILNELTSVRWGYVSSGARSLYVTSVEIPIKVGAIWPRKGGRRDASTQFDLDIAVDSKYPSTFDSPSAWLASLTAELTERITPFVQQWLPDSKQRVKTARIDRSSEIAEFQQYAEEQNQKYPNYIIDGQLVVGEQFFAWHEQCITYGFG